MYSASGKHRYGYSDLFGPETHYSKAESTFDFHRDASGLAGNEVELIERPNGNLRVSSVNPTEFG